MRPARSSCLTICLAALAACGGGGGNQQQPPASDCPSGLSKTTVGTAEMCLRAPTDEAEAYDEGNDTPTCGDARPVDLSCFSTPPTAPPTPATVTIEGYVDTFGLEKSTTGVTVQIRKPDGTVLGTAIADANHPCARTKSLSNGKTATLAGYTISGVPTNTYVVIKNTGTGFRSTNIYGKFFSSADCRTAPTVNDNACRSGCFVRGGTTVLRYDTNIISDQTWAIIPLTAGYSRGIAPGNAAIAGQVHDCNNNRLRKASVAFGATSRAKLLTYFNANCEDPTANNAEPFTNKNGLYAILDAQAGPVKMSAQAKSGGTVVNLGIYDVELFPNSVTILTFGPPLPTVQ